ncbi:hypothetical protein [Rhodospirillum rubrum]|uniref:Uncharacterized protein n=1 Tax=Rhodospirillum rubrum (strain ATCC 11170 / ATH 1.1.1 / DSM 467 / LMG 4362 / NCIMB 8255 / S1) TaxID=269796 RepID=Q2RYG4_RHORT|nr:hypothetical protein [Rhodospirillum rubrum]ABC20831.1 hypothetical protein Rru_A0026 [Rhodospirillum rubrum ATCC 11170]AEO46498.1 hypothetical protein F11_00135 [Rhodospirillum rubrum F11]QXG80534.1 hypothetical protein KUL73_00135 [Rhodospirillum rubrum]HAQ00588.1 hypothetical protein [Rhodospirillum rubrum]HCF18562.1 hypothetical protein [Rhodospirillum rubrum]
MARASTKSAPASAAPPASASRPAPVKVKGRVQEGYVLMRALLERAGHAELATRLGQWQTVDQVLAAAPELVPTLLGMAWELRNREGFSDLFAAPDGGVVDNRADPIAPCGRSFDQIVQSHLYATARVVFTRNQGAWAVAEAKRAQARWRKEQEEAPKGLFSRLFGRKREPVFNPQDFLTRCPSHGLYEALKPHLSRLDQFALIPAYAQLRRTQAEVLGDLIARFNQPDQILFLAGLTEGDISVLRNCARIYAEFKLKLRKPKRGRDEPDQRLSEEDEARLLEEESRVFRDLMSSHHKAIDELRIMGPNAEKLIHLVAPVFGDRIWAIFDDPAGLRNVVNTPEHLLPALGPFSRYVTPELSATFLQMNDQEIIKDILRFGRETFKEAEYAFYLSDSSRLPVWSSLPQKFNNNFKYQRDALKSGLVRNEMDLRTVAGGVFESLRQGKVL